MWPECEEKIACCKEERQEPIIPKLVRDLGSELTEIHGLTSTLADEVGHLRGERENTPHECDCLVDGLRVDLVKAKEIKNLMRDILSMFREL